MYPPIATEHTDGRDTPDRFVQRRQRLDLATMQIGQTVEVRTHNSRWWFTRTDRCNLHGDFLRGFAVTSDSRNKGENKRPPSDTFVERFILTGSPVRMSHTGAKRTGEVLSFVVL